MDETSHHVCSFRCVEGEITAVCASTERWWKRKSNLGNSRGFLSSTIEVLFVKVTFKNLGISLDC